MAGGERGDELEGEGRNAGRKERREITELYDRVMHFEAMKEEAIRKWSRKKPRGISSDYRR